MKTAQVVTFSKEMPTQEFQVNPARIGTQMFFYTVTAQLVNFGTEVVLPYVKRKVFKTAKEVRGSGSANIQDHEEEAAFMERVRTEMELEDYDVTADYREMVMQFGKSAVLDAAEC